MYNRECQNYPELRHRAATADRYYLAQNLLHNNWKPELFLNTPAMESATYYRVPQHKMYLNFARVRSHFFVKEAQLNQCPFLILARVVFFSDSFHSQLFLSKTIPKIFQDFGFMTGRF